MKVGLKVKIKKKKKSLRNLVARSLLIMHPINNPLLVTCCLSVVGVRTTTSINMHMPSIDAAAESTICVFISGREVEAEEEEVSAVVHFSLSE